MKGKIGRSGYTVLKSEISPEKVKECKEELTLQLNGNESIRVYRENAAKLYLPKHYGYKHFGAPESGSQELQNRWTNPVTFQGSLREHQHEPVQVCLDNLTKSTTPGGILQLYCGAGKTTCALYMIAQLQVKTLVIVHKEFLMTQWRESIEKFLPDAQVGRIQQNTVDTKDKHIVLGMLKSLAMKEYPFEVFSQFDLVIIDECHFVCSKTFSKALFKMAGARYTLGLSATPNRADSMECIFLWHLGPVLYEMKREQVKCDVKVYNYKEEKGLYSETKNKRGDIQVSTMMTQIIGNGMRTYFIAKMILDAFFGEDEYPKRKVLVLSERRTHLENILRCMKEEKKRRKETREITCGYFYGGLSEEDRARSAQCNVILGTYQMASVGLDIDGLNTLVLATSKPGIIRNADGEQITGSMEQSVGRIFRKAHTAVTPLIIDIADKFSVFSSQAYKRIQFYRQCGYNVDTFKVKENTKEGKVEFS